MSTRVAVVDLGSNSTRLLIADVSDDRTVSELDRRSIVTRLGEGVERTGRLDDEAMERVHAVLATYRQAIDALHADVAVGVLTSAVRDAANGARFAETVRTRFGIAARTIAGDEEARLTYLGATSDRGDPEPTAVIDIGGGSTEIVVGCRAALRFHVSTQVGVVRHGERHLHDDPPTAGQLQALRADVAATFAAALPDDLETAAAIAVAGTATQSSAMLGGASRLERDRLAELLDTLAAQPLAQRRRTPGLDPDRAPTIVAGIAILLEAMAALGRRSVEVSEHDVLRGVALEHTAFLSAPPHF